MGWARTCAPLSSPVAVHESSGARSLSRRNSAAASAPSQMIPESSSTCPSARTAPAASICAGEGFCITQSTCSPLSTRASLADGSGKKQNKITQKQFKTVESEADQ